MVIPALAQEQLDHMDIEQYEPRTTLVVAEHPITHAKYPVIDVHSHWFRGGTMTAGALDSLVAEMDEMNMGVMVNLSGGSGDRLKGNISKMEGRFPNRFVTFANVNFDSVGAPGWTERAVAQFNADIAAGARGLKIYKSLGMTTKDVDGNRVAVDDERIAPIWDAAGAAGVPVLIHTADPAEFWQPRDSTNERWLELKLRPQRYRAPGAYPPFEELLAEQHRMFENHPGTSFINAHLGWLGHDLDKLSALLTRLPNVFTEVGAVLYELGRQPRSAREFLIEHKDRVLFGKDAYNQVEYHAYFRTFETADEYFDYYRKYHAFWKLYGLDLPDDVLRHIYYRNALRLIPGFDKSQFPN